MPGVSSFTSPMPKDHRGDPIPAGMPRVRMECEGCGHVSGWLDNPRLGPQYVMCDFCEHPMVAALTIVQLGKASRDSVMLLGRRVPKS